MSENKQATAAFEFNHENEDGSGFVYCSVTETWRPAEKCPVCQHRRDRNGMQTLYNGIFYHRAGMWHPHPKEGCVGVGCAEAKPPKPKTQRVRLGDLTLNELKEYGWRRICGEDGNFVFFHESDPRSEVVGYIGLHEIEIEVPVEED